jgi:DNA-binding NarL/FixJ family response regulator
MSDDGPIALLLVDDHAVVRHGLRGFLELQADITVAGEAASGREAVEVARRLRPDVVLMDLVMPGGDGIEALRAIRVAVPDARVLVLTSFVDDVQVFAAMEAGAAGYLLKDVSPDALATAVRDVHAGRPALGPAVAERLMRRGGGDAGNPRLASLTARERDVLRLMVDGLANKQIARRLSITEKTVKTHVSSILGKLGVADRTQASVLALRSRLVE